jgi:hypothetical protein
MDITREHPEYKGSRRLMKRYSDLYAGGEQLKTSARDYLEMRQKEPYDVYMERLARVYYENYIGSIIDWYAATLFKREPVIEFEGKGDAGRKYFSCFLEDCDQRGTTLAAMLRQQFVSALVHGKSYLLVDFPRPTAPVSTWAEEEEAGLSHAYLVDFTEEELINWSRDERGVFDWVVLRQVNRNRSSLEDVEGPRTETRYLYFDRTNYKTFVKESEKGVPLLVDEGTHGLAEMGMVPLFELKVTDGLWLMNKAALIQLEHFNKSNALSWALSMGLFAMPVVYTDRQWEQIVGESYYIQLAPNDRFGWTEPEGKVFQIASENLARLQEEIYRVCYLLHQARGVHSSALSQSGMSKARDFAVTQEVLRAYGDQIKDYTKRVLRAIAGARKDELLINVSGMDDFDIAEFTSDLEDAERLLGMGMESPTLRAHIYKRLASKYLCDVRQEIKDRIHGEIDGELLGRKD